MNRDNQDETHIPNGGGDLAYAPSKGPVNQLTRSLVIEWDPRGSCRM